MVVLLQWLLWWPQWQCLSSTAIIKGCNTQWTHLYFVDLKKIVAQQATTQCDAKHDGIKQKRSSCKKKKKKKKKVQKKKKKKKTEKKGTMERKINFTFRLQHETTTMMAIMTTP